MAPTSGFFESNIILIFFVYGLAFFLMGVVVAVESRRTSALSLARSLWLLGVFGLLNGMVGWIDMFVAMPGPTPTPSAAVLSHVIQPLNCFTCHQTLGAAATAPGWDASDFAGIIKLLLLIAAPAALLMFGVKLIQDTFESARQWLTWVPLAMVILLAISFFLGRDLIGEGMNERLITAGILARYILFVPASVVAAAALVAQRRPFAALGLQRIGRDTTWAAAIFGLCGILDGLVVPPAPFFPASVIDYATFFALTGIPVQAFRAVAALSIAYFVVRTLRIFEIEYRRSLSLADEQRFRAQQEALAAQQIAKTQLEMWNQELEMRFQQRTKEVEQRNRELAILEERDRLAAELHDTLGQVLGYLNLKTLTTRNALSAGKSAQAMEQLKDIEKAVNAACADVRESILSLRTTVTQDKGIVQSMSEFLERYSEQTGLNVDFSTGGLDGIRFPLETELQLLRIIQEALTNVRKHARASLAWLHIKEGKQAITFTVGDNGEGFMVRAPKKGPRHRFGLQIMRERTERIGGQLTIISTPGNGTRVLIKLPKTALGGEGDGAYQCASGG